MPGFIAKRKRAVLVALPLLALLAASQPVQASEVVKLARLVLTGQRASPDRLQAQARLERLPPVLVEGQRTDPQMQLAEQSRRGGLPRAL